MRNPLRKRHVRELKSNFGKYIALFLFLVITIGFVSGFLVADGSMSKAYNDSFETKKIEDGHFVLAQEADDAFLDMIEENGVKVYEQYYVDKDISDDITVRIYKNRKNVNQLDIMEGHVPEKNGEIAIDRLFAENNDINIGDTIEIDNNDYKVSGFAAFSDYSALFKNNTDMMFDANGFTVSVVNDSDFDDLAGDNIVYCYVWRNNDTALSEKEQGDIADDILDTLNENAMITDFVKRADNNAIMFTGEDMGSDLMMMIAMLYIVIVVLAFIFAITTRDTLEHEASVIGTLRASGYTKGELVRHYLALPLIVNFIAAVIGNILGYTVMKWIVVNMYYRSYSLPTYITVWNMDAFIQTTIIPCIIILIVNLIVLLRTFSISPLQFLRHEVRKRKKKRASKLPNFKFLTRFRIRIIFQNISAYIVMFIGIMFASLILFFGISMLPMLEDYKAEIQNTMISDYQYILKGEVETDSNNAEKFCVSSLCESVNDEEISIYGIKKNSDYLENISCSDKEKGIVVSEGYLEKFGYKVGDTVILKKKYDGDSYEFTITDSCYYPASLAVFMTIDNYNDTFDNDDDYYNGYFSNEKLDDIDEAYIATVITEDDLTIMTDQLDDSMGQSFFLLIGFSVLIYIIIMYLLAKLIIEKNEQSISMVKILGYSSREASKLYNRATAIVVLISLLANLPISYYLFREIFHIFMMDFNGWLTFNIPLFVYPEMIAIGVICYLVIHLILMRKVRKIPMSQALKSDE